MKTDVWMVVDVDADERRRLSIELSAGNRCSINVHASLELALTEEGSQPRILVLGAEPERVVQWTQRARELYERTTLVVTSHFFSAATAFDIARAGADMILLKPVSGSQLRCLAEGKADPNPHAWPSLARAEWEYMQATLRACHGNRSEAARRLCIHRSVLQRKLSRHPPPR